MILHLTIFSFCLVVDVFACKPLLFLFGFVYISVSFFVFICGLSQCS